VSKPEASKWERRFLELAHHVATWSRDPSTKVGCVIVDQRNRVLGMGYNGFPRGVEDLPERYADRPTKYALVVHSEPNAIANVLDRDSLLGARLFCTHMPCNECTKHIIQAGIHIVFCPPPDMERWAESQEWSKLMLAEAGVELVFI
jgi:dCMP deaminase